MACPPCLFQPLEWPTKGSSYLLVLGWRFKHVTSASRGYSWCLLPLHHLDQERFHPPCWREEHRSVRGSWDKAAGPTSSPCSRGVLELTPTVGSWSQVLASLPKFMHIQRCHAGALKAVGVRVCTAWKLANTFLACLLACFSFLAFPPSLPSSSAFLSSPLLLFLFGELVYQMPLKQAHHCS